MRFEREHGRAGGRDTSRGRSAPRKARQRRVILAAALGGLLLAGCGDDGAAYSAEAVIDAFSGSGIELSEVLRHEPSDGTLDVILENTLTDACQVDEALIVNVFHSEDGLVKYLERSRSTVTTEWQRAGDDEGRRFGNLLIGLRRSNPCFSRAAVEVALGELK